MKYIKINFGNEYCGCDGEKYLAFEDDSTEEEIDEYAYELAIENANSYSYLYTGWENDFEDEDDEENYYSNIEFFWEEVSKEEWIENNGAIA